MIIKRKLYSKKEEKDSSKKKGTSKSVAIGAGTVAAGQIGGLVLGKKFKKLLESESSEEGEKIFDKLKRYAERKGVKVDEYTTTGMGPAYHKGTVYTDGTMHKGISIFGVNVAGGKTGKGRHGDLISHEIGHAHFDKGKAKGIGEKIGKAAHKVYLKGGAAQHSVIAPLAGIVAGVRSGKKKARLEEKGEKESKLNRHSAWGTSLAVQTPGLVSEAAASKYGYNLMKKAGASKKYLKGAKKNLIGAFGTYAALAATNAGTGELARGIAYKQEKKKIEKAKKEKEEKEDK